MNWEMSLLVMLPERFYRNGATASDSGSDLPVNHGSLDSCFSESEFWIHFPGYSQGVWGVCFIFSNFWSFAVFEERTHTICFAGFVNVVGRGLSSHSLDVCRVC